MSNERAVCAEGIRSLCHWAASVRFSDIPANVQARAVHVLADDLAAIVGARDEPEVARFHQRTLSQTRPREATVFRGGRQRTDAVSAIAANALAADWLELDEGYRPVSCHAGLYALPALLAECEWRDRAFSTLVRALVLSYEISTRLARAWTLKAMTIQPHGRFSAIGSAAAVALARGFDGQQLAGILGTAVTLGGSSPRTHLAEGTLSRNTWPASGAMSGWMATEWAECGIEGEASAFYDVYSSLLGGTAMPEVLSGRLGHSWAILDGYTKIHACCQHLHSAVEAALELRPALEGKIDQIATLRVETHSLALPLMDATPRTTLGARFSMPHAIASVLLSGSGGAEAFAAATLASAAIASLRPLVSVAPFTPTLPAPNDRPARVVVRLRSGEEFAAECLSARGGPDRPLPPSTVFDKVSMLAGPVYPAMRGVLESLATLPAAGVSNGWAAIVGEMCES